MLYMSLQTYPHCSVEECGGSIASIIENCMDKIEPMIEHVQKLCTDMHVSPGSPGSPGSAGIQNGSILDKERNIVSAIVMRLQAYESVEVRSVHEQLCSHDF